jgi:hypothetical protein
MVISLFIVSCGSETNLIPINTTINMNGFLDNFRGGKIEVKIFNDTQNTCTQFLDINTPITEVEEKLITFDIPKGVDDIRLSQENVNIIPGVKTIYAVLYNELGEKKGHDCQKAIKCSALKEDPLPTDANDISVGDKACVYLDIQLIP